jgi:hypothetical protein
MNKLLKKSCVRHTESVPIFSGPPLFPKRARVYLVFRPFLEGSLLSIFCEKLKGGAWWKWQAEHSK